jgi:hypothetical protein
VFGSGSLVGRRSVAIRSPWNPSNLRFPGIEPSEAHQRQRLPRRTPSPILYNPPNSNPSLTSDTLAPMTAATTMTWWNLQHGTPLTSYASIIVGQLFRFGQLSSIRSPLSTSWSALPLSHLLTVFLCFSLSK